MLTDPLTGARKPEQTDGPLGGLQIANVIDDLAPNSIPSFANATARNTAYSDWVAAGGVMRKGLKSHTQNDDRYWRYDGAAWQYAGGNPPPIVACSPGTGWSLGVRQPGVYKDASGVCHLVGSVTPNSAYNPQDGTLHTAMQLPSGFYPASNTTAVAFVPFATMPQVLVYIQTSGLVAVIGGTVASIGAAAGHYLDGITYHPAYANAVPLA